MLRLRGPSRTVPLTRNEAQIRVRSCSASSDQDFLSSPWIGERPRVPPDQLRCCPKQAVAHADVTIEEGSGLPVQSFQPQTDAAELGGHRVHVEAAADHVAQGALVE